MTENKLGDIGLKINPSKSTVINIKQGKLVSETITTISNQSITLIGANEKIKYLGVSYNESLILDQEVLLNRIGNNLETLSKSSLLNCDQKLNILNEYLSPTLIYSLQTAPLNKIPKFFLENIDKLIRSTVREILQLPGDTPNSFLYASKSVKGLGIFNSSWEAYIQQFNKFLGLERFKCEYYNHNFDHEKQFCLDKLKIGDSEKSKMPQKDIGTYFRKILREREFSNWCGLQQKGIGVVLYEEVKAANHWIYKQQGLSNSEWRDCLKMTCNVAAVRAVPGRSTSTNLCRYCREFESLAHVLCYCEHGETARIKRHNDIRQLIAQALRDKDFEVHEEVCGLSEADSIRRIDMIAIDRKKNIAFIIDPTVRFENSREQPDKVHLEKVRIYEPTIPHYKAKFNISEITIIGLFFGARGTLTKYYINFRKKFKLRSSLDSEIVLKILKSSVYILRNHLFGIPKIS